MIRVEATLIEAAARGDSGALANLLSVCQPDLKRFARRTCSTTEDAEDAVQVALWQLYRKIGGLRTVATFATWLFRIVERERYRLYRGRSKTRTWTSWRRWMCPPRRRCRPASSGSSRRMTAEE